MKVALVGDELIFAGPDAPGTAACPSCGSVVLLRCREGKTYYWRHARIPHTCALKNGPPPGKDGPSSDGANGLASIARKVGGTVLELPDGQTFTLTGPGVVILVGSEGEQGGPSVGTGLEPLLEPYARLEHLECDGLTRVLSTVLRRHRIVHGTCVGTLTHVPTGRSLSPHFWLVLFDGRFVDYRARCWLGDDGVPHGVFAPDDHPSVQYAGQPVTLEPLDDSLFEALVRPWPATTGRWGRAFWHSGSKPDGEVNR